MNSELVEVQLENLAGGAAAELFDLEWARLLENIQDPNTPPDAKRSLTIKVSVKPDESRQEAMIAVDVSAKLAGPRPAGSTIYMGQKDGKNVAVHYDPRQSDLFREDEDSDITPLPTRKVEE